MPRMSAEQVRDLSLAHHVNLDAIASGLAGEDILWQQFGGALTWSHVAQLLGVGEPEMAEQLQLMRRVIDRYHTTGRVFYAGPDYEIARRGVIVMDTLAATVDVLTALEAAAWSEVRIETMARERVEPKEQAR